jgi:RNA polymerase sigma-70 factor, ECF subfamily
VSGAVASVVVETLPNAAQPAAGPSAIGTEDPLATVLAGARAGDGAAFAALYRRFASVVHGIALARVGPADADDLVQEVFVTVHRALGRVRDPRAFPGWIVAVSRNAATDRLRRKARARDRSALVDLPAREAPREDGELRGRVLARLQELPEAYREPLLLRLVEGLSGPEIAERTGLTPGSVRVNLSRGLALLRPLLEKDGWR